MAKIDLSKQLDQGIKKLEETVKARGQETKAIKQTEKATESLNKDRLTERELLEAIVKGQTRMIQSLNSIHSATNRTSKSTRNLNRQNLLWIKNTRILGGSLAVLRSKLLVFTFGIGLLERSVGKLMDAYGDLEASQKRVERVIASTGGAAGVTSEEVFAMNAAFMKSTGVAEVMINNASAIILTFTSIGKEVLPEVTQAVLDMTAIMYQGNFTLEALKTTSIQVGKALNDPIRGLNALRRVGVSFNASQKKIIKALQNTSQLSKAQGIILKELQKEFGKQSEIEGYSKSLRQLNTEVGNLAERIGKDLRDAILPIIDGLRKFIEELDSQTVITFTKSLIGVTLVFGVLKKSLTIWLGLLLRNVKTLSKFGKVLLIQTRNILGFGAAARKASVLVRGLTLAVKGMSGVAGIGAILALTSLFTWLGKTDDKTEEYTGTLEGAIKKLDNYDDAIKDAGENHKALMDVAVKYNAVEVGGLFIKTAATISEEKLTAALKKRRIELNNDIEVLRLSTVVTGEARTEAEKLSDEVFKQVERFEQLNFILDATYSGDHIKNVQDYDNNLKSLLYVDKQLIKEKKLLASVVSKLGLNVDTTTGLTLSYEEAIKKIPPELRHVLDINLELNTAIEAQNALRKVNIDLAKQTLDANIALTSGLVSSLNSISTSWHGMKISQLESQAALDIQTVEDTVRNERLKATKIKDIEEKLFEDKKKLHNQNIFMQQLATVAEFAIAAQRVIAQTQVAKSAMAAQLIASGVGVLAIVGALAALDSMMTKQLVTIGAASVASVGSLQMQRMAHGGDFTTTGPQMIMVGDNPGGRERVQVTPLSSPNIAGPQGGGGGITVNVTGNVMSQDYVEGELAEQIKEAIRRGNDFGIS